MSWFDRLFRKQPPQPAPSPHKTWRDRAHLLLKRVEAGDDVPAAQELADMADKAPTADEAFAVFTHIIHFHYTHGRFQQALDLIPPMANAAHATEDNIRNMADVVEIRADILSQMGLEDAADENRAVAMKARTLDAVERYKPDDEWDQSDPDVARHRPTNLHCAKTLPGMSRLRVFTYGTDDVGANYTLNDLDRTTVSFYLTRRKPEDSLMDDFHAAKTGIGPTYKSIEQVGETAFAIGPLEIHEANFRAVAHSGISLLCDIWVADLKGWTLKARASHPPEITVKAVRGAVEEFFRRALVDVKT